MVVNLFSAVCNCLLTRCRNALSLSHFLVHLCSSLRGCQTVLLGFWPSSMAPCHSPLCWLPANTLKEETHSSIRFQFIQWRLVYFCFVEELYPGHFFYGRGLTFHDGSCSCSSSFSGLCCLKYSLCILSVVPIFLYTGVNTH